MRSPTPKYEIGDELWYVYHTGYQLKNTERYSLQFKMDSWELKKVKITSITLTPTSVQYAAQHYNYIGEDNLFHLKHQAVIFATEKYNMRMEKLLEIVREIYEQQALKLVTPD